MPASILDMWKWSNWYWLPTDDIEEDLPKKETKPKKKRRTKKSKPATKVEEIPIVEEKTIPGFIQLNVSKVVLEELQKEAQQEDITLHQLIENILEVHLQSKTEPPAEQESWKCAFCEPQEEFLDYFEYSQHFFAQHMHPDLQKLSEANANLR